MEQSAAGKLRADNRGIAMLLEFRVSNHRSIREEQVLTTKAVANLGGPDDLRPRNIVGIDGSYLPAIAIYGANASGKSNVLSAILFMQEAVLSSHRLWEPDSGVPRECFAWGNSEEGSIFEVDFTLDGTRYRYGFDVDDNRIREEWLFSYLNGNQQMWFQREGKEFEFGKQFEEARSYVSMTGSNSLFLSASSQNRNQKMFPIYTWFRSISAINMRQRTTLSHRWGHGSSRMATLLSVSAEKLTPKQRNLVERFRTLLRVSDFGVVNMKVTDSTDKKVGRHAFYLEHGVEHDDPWLPLSQESNGTQTMFRIALQILESLDSGSPLLFDELETSLHPLLAIEIVNLFNDPVRNPKHAQLVFTTHDSNLLGTTIGEPVLRRDQIFLTEKDHKTGSTCAYPLTNYKPRKSENLERGYLQGRYGAIPFLGSFAEVAIGEETTE